MAEHLARVVVADQVVWEGSVPAGHVPTVTFERGAQLTANSASGPVPIPGRFAADVTIVRFAPAKPKRKPATRKPKSAKPTRKKAIAK